jgi:selT/selW/selH-like putative selenoprotein
VSLATELLSAWAPIMRSVELRSGTSGRFEVTLDGELIFSKVALKRHPRPKEISDEFEKRIGKPLEWRQA